VHEGDQADEEFGEPEQFVDQEVAKNQVGEIRDPDVDRPLLAAPGGEQDGPLVRLLFLRLRVQGRQKILALPDVISHG